MPETWSRWTHKACKGAIPSRTSVHDVAPPKEVKLEEIKGRELSDGAVDKFYQFNRVVFGLCQQNECTFLNAAPLFFRFKSGVGRSLNIYFKEDPDDEVHLSKMGTSVLARQFIYVISRHNNTRPTAY